MRIYPRRVILIVMIILLTVGCDQATKLVARARLQDKGTVQVVDNVLVLRYADNQGGFLSLGSRLPVVLRTILLIAFPIVVLAAAILAMVRSGILRWPLLTGLSLVAGGGVGNLIDRLFRAGHVTDFLNLGIGNFRTGIFNVADLAVLAGCIFIIFSRGREPPPKPDNPA